MAKRNHNPGRAKINRSYTVNTLAELYDIHKNSVRAWLKQGLSTIDNLKPFLIHGQSVRDFLTARRNKNKCKCQIDEIYCVKCRAPKKPWGLMADYLPPISGDLGNIVGICPDCEGTIYRRTSSKRLEMIRQHLDITIPMANQRIYDID